MLVRKGGRVGCGAMKALKRVVALAYEVATGLVSAEWLLQYFFTT